MIRKKTRAFLALLCAFCLGMTAFSAIPSLVLAEAGSSIEGQTVNYDGTTTGVYSLEKYAGFEGDYWILDTVAQTVTAGDQGRRLGSGTGDNRQVTITLKVNSSVAEQAKLRLWAEFYDANSSAAISVNGQYIDADGNAAPDNDPVNINLFEINNTMNIWLPTSIPVTLVEGDNEIKIEMIHNYNAWMEGFEICSSNGLVASDGTSLNIRPQAAMSYANNPMVNSTSWGKDTDDSPASATYIITAEKDGYYNLRLGVEAGDDSANGAFIKVNDNEEEYLEFDTSLGWGLVGITEKTLFLKEGDNTVIIGQHIPETKTKVNWWLKSLNISYKTVKGITVNTENAKVIYNPYQNVSVDGLVIDYYDTEDSSNDKQLDLDDVTFTLPLLSNKGGSYPVIVEYENEDGFICKTEYLVNVVSEAIQCESSQFEYNGISTGKLALFGETGHIGIFSSEGKGIAWFNNKKSDPVGYEIGSGSDDGRQLDMEFVINSSVQANAKFILYGSTYASETSGAVVTVNDEEVFEGNLYSIYGDGKMSLIMPLDIGLNTINITMQTGYDMWIYAFGLEPAPEAVLILDVSDIDLEYNPYQALDLSGLKGTFSYDGVDTELEYEDFVIDDSQVNMDKLGSYKVIISYDNGSVLAQEEITVKVIGEGKNVEGGVINYDGEQTQKQAIYTRDGKVGLLGDGQNKVYWIMQELDENYPEGFEIGSSADTSRKLTLRFVIDSSVSGKTNLIIFGEFYPATSSAKLSVNGSETLITPYASTTQIDGLDALPIEIELNQGENTVEVAFSLGYDCWLRAYMLDEIETVDETDENNDDDDQDDQDDQDGDNQNGDETQKRGCKASVSAAALLILVLGLGHVITKKM